MFQALFNANVGFRGAWAGSCYLFCFCLAEALYPDVCKSTDYG